MAQIDHNSGVVETKRTELYIHIETSSVELAAISLVHGALVQTLADCSVSVTFLLQSQTQTHAANTAGSDKQTWRDKQWEQDEVF